jgi:carbon monoxide dehydrogenase subunit G
VEIRGEYQIGSARETVWEALNDPEVLKRCIPGCDSLEKESDTDFKAKVTTAIGPVKAKFNTRISLQDLIPPESYTLAGESKAVAAGFGRGTAKVKLVERDGGTLLSYEADFKVGGKLAQVGSRLVLGATRKVADEFFGTFSSELDPAAVKIGDGTSAAAASAWSKAGLFAVAAALLLLIGWFLLR